MLMSRHRIDDGLSPLARGTLERYNSPTMLSRFIPAGAGNSRSEQNLLAGLTVYPRWRGELGRTTREINQFCGLSPLARGTPGLRDAVKATERFIPAGAGNSRVARCREGNRAVYPRWRGELCKHNLLLINDFLSQSQSTNFIVSHKQHIHYVKEHLIH